MKSQPAILWLAIITGCNGPDLTPACGEGSRECKKGVYDWDGDGYCENRDCDEASCNVNPGAEEICNNIDDDCDGVVDAADKNFVERSIDNIADYYIDRDGDGYCGDEKATMCIDWTVANIQYYDKDGAPFYVCLDYTADQRDSIEADSPDYFTGMFDCCDAGTEDACSDTLPDRCVYPKHGVCEEQACYGDY